GRLTNQLRDREALYIGHRGHLLAHALAGDDKQRLDEVGWAQLCLAHEVAKRLGTTQATHSCSRKAHENDSRVPAVRPGERFIARNSVVVARAQGSDGG